MKQKLLLITFEMLFLLICKTTLAAPAATITYSNPSCSGSYGTATITIAADTKLEDFTYYFSGTGNEEALPSSPYTITGLEPGVEYTIEVNMSGSQEAKEVFVLSEGDSPSISDIYTSDASNCYLKNGEIEIAATSDVTEYTIDGVNWTTGDAISATAGTYPASKILVRTANGCEATWKGDDIVVGDDFEYMVGAMDYLAYPPSCIGENDGQISLSNSEENTTYSIDGGSTYSEFSDFSGLTGGQSYAVKVNYNNSCYYDGPTIELPNPQQATIDNVETTSSSITITASENAGTDNGITREDMGDITFSIDNGVTYQTSGEFTGLTAGDYNVVIKYGDCETVYSGNPVTIVAVTYSVTFNVTYNNNGVENANVQLENTGTQTTNANGQVVYTDVAATTYGYWITLSGYNNVSGTVTVTDADVTENVALTPAPLDGTLIVDEGHMIFEYGRNLTATLSGSNNTGTLNYQWLRDGSEIIDATSSGYTVVQEDVGTILSVNVTSTVQTGTLTAESPVIAKADQNAPAYPTMASRTSTSITLTAVDGCEYMIGGGSWQASPEFTGLTPDTEYIFSQRYAETAAYNPSNSESANFSTTEAGPNALTGTVTVTGGNQYLDEIEASVTDDNNTGTLSYQWKRNGSAISGATSDKYTLTADDIATTVTVDVTSNVETGTISGSAGIIEKANQDAPAAPTMASNTSSSITLTAVEGCEYALGEDLSWQTSPEFLGLTAGEVYEFYQRYAETATHKASYVSSAGYLSTQEEEVQPIVNIPDANFKAALLANTSINTNEDDEIQVSEAEAYDGTISVSELGISDLTGIEAFVSITSLWCSNNSISTIDLSNSPNFRTLYCNNNQLTSINLNNTDLRTLSCYRNQLTSLDLSAFPSLRNLSCQSNNLTSLNVSGCTQLTNIDCSSNELTTIDISTCSNLTILQAHVNNLTSANIANGACSSYETMLLNGNSGLTCVQIDEDFTPPTAGSDGWNYNDGVSFSTNCNALPSSDATLSDLVVGITTIDGFSPDTYAYEKVNSYCAASANYVTATATDANASVSIEQAAPSNNDVATITVTAKDGTTQLIYTVAFSSSDEIVITSVTPINADCPGDFAQGGFEVVASGGNGTLEYGFYTTDDIDVVTPVGQDYYEKWTPEASYSGLLKANYQIKVRDEDGCVAIWNDGNTETFSSPTLTASAAKTNVTENGGNNGTITITADVQNTSLSCNYSYVLVDGTYTNIEDVPEDGLHAGPQTNNVFNDLTAGDYSVLAMARVGMCEGQLYYLLNVTITEPAQNAITGTVTITGTYQYGETLTAEVSESNNTGDFSYQWQRNGNNISGATAQTYIAAEADINNLITVIVTSSVESGSITNSLLCEIEKADQETPNAPTLSGKTYNSITLNTVNGCEYAIDGGDWQTSATFNTLSAETEYSFTQRYAETSTHNASEASEADNITTDTEPMNALTGTVTISGTMKYGETLATEVNNSNNTGALGYQWKRNGSNISGATSEIYVLAETDIDAEISVTVCSSVETGSISSESVKIKKADQETPDIPTLASKTHNSITLNTVSGCEYAINGGSWQTSATFNNLNAETEYSFTQRYAETSTHNTSEASGAYVITTDTEPVNALTGTVTINGTLQYNETLTAIVSNSNNTGTLSYQWKRSGSNINGATYETYVLAEEDIDATISAEVTSSVEEGTISSAETATIGKADQQAPAIPTLAEKTYNSITLNPINGCEYAINGESWKMSVAFNNLLAETEYSFTQRYAETSTYNASGASETFIVITDAEPVNALTGTVIISGTFQYGQTLTATVTNTNNTGALNYHWKRNGETISGASGETYSLTEDDIATHISVVVTSSVEEGSISSSETASINKADQTAPAAPTLASQTQTNITLNAVDGCEYAIRGGAWQSSVSFTNLTPGKTYSIVQRYAQTTTHYASAESAALGVTLVPSEDNTLSDLMMDGKTIEGFHPDTLDYTIYIDTKSYDIPEIEVELNDPTASVEIIQATTIPGEATIKVTAGNGDSRTYTIHFKIATAVNELNLAEFKCYPNPALERLFVDVPASMEIDAIRVLSITGEQHYFEYVSIYARIEINTSQYSPGVYFVQIIDKTKNIYSKKIIKN